MSEDLALIADKSSFAWKNLLGRDDWISFTPVFGSLTVVGATDYQGRLRLVGKKCEFQVVFHAATSITSTGGTDYLTLPITARGLSGAAVVTADNANLYVGTCHIDVVTSRCYLPTIAASDDWFTIAGWFEINGPSITRTGGGTWTPPAVSATVVTVADAGGDTTTFPMLAPSATGAIGPLTDAGLTYDASTNTLTSGVVNVPTGGAFTISGTNVVRAQTSDQNYYFGNSGNLTATGNYNVAAGLNALLGLTLGNYNVGIGAAALYTNTTGGQNTALGVNALHDNLGGSYNVGIGESPLLSNQSGDDNVAIGQLALYSNVSGHRSVAIGSYAGAYETASDTFYLNNQNRTNTAGDKAKSLLYGTFNANEALQTLKCNGTFTATALVGPLTGDVTGNVSGTASGLSATLVVGSGGTGAATLADGGLVIGNGTSAVEVVSAGLTTQILVGGGALTAPVWTTATGTGAPVRAGSPTITGTLAAASGTFSGTLGVTGALTATAGVRTSDVFESATNGVAAVAINYVGYAAGTTQFRNFQVYDGKSASVLSIVGSTKAVSIPGTLGVTGATTLSSTLSVSDDATFSQNVTIGTAGFITPESRGAVGNGTTDDTTAMTNAISDAVTAGKPLLLGKATYKTTTQITVTLTAQQCLKIIGMPTAAIDNGTTFSYSGSVINFVPSSGTPYWLQIKGNAAAGQNVMVELESFMVYCNGSVATSGIKFGDTDAGITSHKYMTVKDVIVANCSGYGFHIVDSSKIHFYNCWLDEKDDATANVPLRIEVADTGTDAMFCGDLYFNGCQFIGNGTASTHAVEIAAAAKASGSANVLAGLHFADCGGANSEYTVYIADTTNTVTAKIDDIFFESCAFDQAPSDPQCVAGIRCEIYGELNNLSISDCYINSYQQSCVSIYGYSTTVMSNISVENCFLARTGPETTAGAFITGVNYVISTVGTTDFTAIGAASNTVGLGFAATGAGTGTGTAARSADAIDINIENGGTCRSVNITNNQLLDIALQPDGVGNGGAIIVLAGNIKEFNISNNNNVLNKTMGANLVYPPDYLLSVGAITSTPDYGVIVGNVGRWQQGAHYTGTITNNAIANNLTRTGNAV